MRLRPCWPGHVWAYDFVQDRTHDGRRFRMLTVIDEYTRECLAIVVARRLTSDDVLHLLCDLFVERGPPDHIRSDNGPEFTARAVRGWLVTCSPLCYQSEVESLPVRGRVSSLLIRTPSLDRRKVEFSGFNHVGGLAAPSGFISEIGGLLPMAPCGRSSL